jgi:hypothetical protein
MATHTTSEIPGRNSVDFDQSDTSDTTQEDSENYNLNQEVLASAGYKRARATEIREECRIANAMARHANFGYPRCEPLRHMIDEDGVLQTVLAEETRIKNARNQEARGNAAADPMPRYVVSVPESTSKPTPMSEAQELQIEAKRHGEVGEAEEAQLAEGFAQCVAQVKREWDSKYNDPRYSHWEVGKMIARGNASMITRAIYDVGFRKFMSSTAAT